MTKYTQLYALAKQEFKRNIRSKSILIIILFMPMLLWGLQAGILYLNTEESKNLEGETFYFVNLDSGNGTYNFGELIEAVLDYQTSNNASRIYNFTMVLLDYSLDPSNPQLSYDTIQQDVLDKRYSPLVIVEHNFTRVYDNYDNSAPLPPTVKVLALPNDNQVGNQVLWELNNLMNTPPFLIASYDHVTYSSRIGLTMDGEEAVDRFQVFIVTFFSIYGALIAPAGLVTNGFAVEREKRTLESLLVLPISKFEIMMTKFLSGSIFLSIFSVVNIFGMLLFNFLSKVIYENSNVEGEFQDMNLSFGDIMLIFLVILLVATTAYGLGIAITSAVKDSRSAGGTYNLVIAMPFAILALIILINGIPDGIHPLYLIPWTHALAILVKYLFPNSDMASKITPYIGLDIFLHAVILVAFIFLSFAISAKLQDKVLKLEG
ncbi:MAG: ABC transporter permease [Candidatus Heimdallarchaeota archaeon]|nr:ABC transporter permease [Candidatus Heimdallarchaeota archaeon]